MPVVTKKDERIIFLFSSLRQSISNLETLFKNYKPLLNNERYLTDKELSDKLHISRRTLQDYRNQGLLSYVQFGGKVLYKESDIEKILENAYYKAWR